MHRCLRSVVVALMIESSPLIIKSALLMIESALLLGHYRGSRPPRRPIGVRPGGLLVRGQPAKCSMMFVDDDEQDDITHDHQLTRVEENFVLDTAIRDDIFSGQKFADFEVENW